MTLILCDYDYSSKNRILYKYLGWIIVFNHFLFVVVYVLIYSLFITIYRFLHVAAVTRILIIDFKTFSVPKKRVVDNQYTNRLIETQSQKFEVQNVFFLVSTKHLWAIYLETKYKQLYTIYYIFFINKYIYLLFWYSSTYLILFLYISTYTKLLFLFYIEAEQYNFTVLFLITILIYLSKFKPTLVFQHSHLVA